MNTYPDQRIQDLVNDLTAAQQEIAELERERAWICRKLDLPEDTPMASGGQRSKARRRSGS